MKTTKKFEVLAGGIIFITGMSFIAIAGMIIKIAGGL